MGFGLFSGVVLLFFLFADFGELCRFLLADFYDGKIAGAFGAGLALNPGSQRVIYLKGGTPINMHDPL